MRRRAKEQDLDTYTSRDENNSTLVGLKDAEK
jgi:hypothetical protein